MKANLIILFALAVAMACQPKKDVTVPGIIKESFEKIHPNATDVQWIEEPSIFEAKFTDGKTKGAISFNEKGEIVETEEVIEQDNLPNLPGIIEYIKTSYPGEIIEQSEKITKHDGTVVYELQIKGKELVFDSQGKFLKEEAD
jgi:hypothetical protein